MKKQEKKVQTREYLKQLGILDCTEKKPHLVGAVSEHFQATERERGRERRSEECVYPIRATELLGNNQWGLVFMLAFVLFPK